MLVKLSENNRKNINENVVELKLQPNIKFSLYICAEKTDVWQLYNKPAK